MIKMINLIDIRGCATRGVRGGPGPPNILDKNVHKIQKKGTLKFSSHYLGPLNNYRVVQALDIIPYITVMTDNSAFNNRQCYWNSTGN